MRIALVPTAVIAVLLGWAASPSAQGDGFRTEVFVGAGRFVVDEKLFSLDLGITAWADGAVGAGRLELVPHRGGPRGDHRGDVQPGDPVSAPAAARPLPPPRAAAAQAPPKLDAFAGGGLGISEGGAGFGVHAGGGVWATEHLRVGGLLYSGGALGLLSTHLRLPMDDNSDLLVGITPLDLARPGRFPHTSPGGPHIGEGLAAPSAGVWRDPRPHRARGLRPGVGQVGLLLRLIPRSSTPGQPVVSPAAGCPSLYRRGGHEPGAHEPGAHEPVGPVQPDRGVPLRDVQPLGAPAVERSSTSRSRTTSRNVGGSSSMASRSTRRSSAAWRPPRGTSSRPWPRGLGQRVEPR